MNRFTLALAARVGLAIVIVPASGFTGIRAAEVMTPHPMIERTGSAIAKQLGDFGESFVDAGLRARGFEVVDGNIGVNGIDRIAVKRASNGEIVDIRLVEVKTRQGLPEFNLAVTRDGTQLSDGWTRPRLERIVREHPNAHTRRLANEVLETMKARPGIVRRELHGIAVQSNKYVVMTVDDAGRVTGVAAEGRLSSLLKMLSNRGTSEETRAAAIRHLAQFDQLQAAVAKAGTEPAVVTKAGIKRLEQAKLLPTGEVTAPPTTVIVEDAAGAKNWVIRLAKQPGVLAAGITFAVDEAFSGWNYYNGDLSKAEFQRQTGQNGIKAATVGIATQLVYIVAPTPHGLVLIGVAIVAYVATDQAISAYDGVFVPQAPKAAELTGIAPARCISAPMLDEVATGKSRAMPVQP